MTYAIGAELQQALFSLLSADAAVQGLVGANIFDAAPSGAQLPPLYVVIGAEVARDRSDRSGQLAVHEVEISVFSGQAGFRQAKDVAAAICDALIDARPALGRGRVVGSTFRRAVARRVEASAQRQIELRFRILVSDE